MSRHDLMRATIATAALDAARRVGLAACLTKPGGIGLNELAGVCGTRPEETALLLDVLAYEGVIEQRDGRWRAPAHLVALCDMVLTGQQLERLLRTGAREFDAGDPDAAGSRYPALVPVLAELSAGHVAALARDLARPGRSVLEVAAGAAPWSRALLELEPTMVATALDLPDVVEAIRPATPEGIRFVAGDVFEVDLEESFDLVIVAGFCRLQSPEANERMFARVGRWCAPGGELVIADAIDTDDARERGLAHYALSLATRTEVGRPWTYEHYARWLAGAGFAGLTLTPTDRPELSFVRARPAT